ncbi:MAG: class I SAM-dependent methyltransferase [Desulfurococcales archaeon]|nr:class I SAM-dependent methyltransferase [Desulfurococcales archaeon]
MDHRVDMSRLYELIGWHTKPDDPASHKRFNDILAFAKKALDNEPLARLAAKRTVKILEVMAASGIAGVAFSKALASRGVGVELLVTDVREEELSLARDWLKIAELDEDMVEVSYAKMDARRLPREVGEEKFDLVLSWGSSIPHFDSFDLPLFLAGSREVQVADGVLVIQQYDLLPGILLNNAFKQVLVEGSIMTFFKEYDALRGVLRRLAYKIPELEYIGIVESRLWDVSQITSMAWIFYKYVDIQSSIDLKRPTSVIIASSPRENAPSWKDLASTIPTPLTKVNTI